MKTLHVDLELFNMLSLQPHLQSQHWLSFSEAPCWSSKCYPALCWLWSAWRHWQRQQSEVQHAATVEWPT